MQEINLPKPVSMRQKLAAISHQKEIIGWPAIHPQIKSAMIIDLGGIVGDQVDYGTAAKFLTDSPQRVLDSAKLYTIESTAMIVVPQPSERQQLESLELQRHILESILAPDDKKRLVTEASLVSNGAVNHRQAGKVIGTCFEAYRKKVLLRAVEALATYKPIPVLSHEIELRDALRRAVKLIDGYKDLLGSAEVATFEKNKALILNASA